MTDQISKGRQIYEWIRSLLGTLDTPLPDLVMRLWHLARQTVRTAPESHGPYQVLDYDSRLELKDAKGKKAVFYKRQRVRFLQDNVIAFQDLAWGDGDIFADYRCSPGVAVDRYRDGHRYRVLISLRETRNRGDEEEFHIQREIQDGFVKDMESFQTEVNHPTRSLAVSVVFPRTRLPGRATLVLQNAAETIELGASNRMQLPDGRVQVVWRTTEPKLYEAYVLRWEW